MLHNVPHPFDQHKIPYELRTFIGFRTRFSELENNAKFQQILKNDEDRNESRVQKTTGYTYNFAGLEEVPRRLSSGAVNALDSESS